MAITKYDSDFKEKRDKVFSFVKQNKKKSPEVQSKTNSKSGDDEPLTVQNLNYLTSIVDGKDMAQVDTESYFNDNIIYFMDDDNRKNLLGKPDKPDLNAALLEIVSDQGVQDWYTKISVPWLALGLNGQKDFNVNAPIIQADVGVLFQRTYYLNQTNLLYHYSYADRVPDIINYVNDTTTDWAKTYKQYLYEQVLPSWTQVTSVQSPDLVSVMMKQWTTKLDILDPTGKTAKDVAQKFTLAMTANQIILNLASVSNTKIFKSILLKSIQDCVDSTENQQPINDIKSLVSQLGGPQAVATEFGASFAAISYSKLAACTTVAQVGEVVAEAGATTWTDTFRNALKALPSWQSLAGGVLLAAAATSFAMGLVYWDVSTNEQKTRTVFNGVATIVLLYQNQMTKNIFSFLAKYSNKFFNVVMRKVASQAVIVSLEETAPILEAIFGTVNRFVNTIVGPALIVASIGFLVYDMVQDVKTKNWGAFSMDLIATLASIGLLVATVFTSLSFSGPLAVICAVIVGLAALIKSIFFKPKTPLQVFYGSLPLKYKDASLAIYKIPATITSNTYLVYKDTSNQQRYVVPTSAAASKLSGSTSLSSEDPFQLKRVTDTGVVILSNPFNATSNIQASFISCRNDTLGEYAHSLGPAVHTESFLPIDAGNNKFYLLAWDSKYIYVNDSNELALDPTKKIAFQFTVQADWFNNKNTSSLIGDNSLKMNSYLANSVYALAFISSGAYIIEMPTDISNFNVVTYIANNPSKIYYTIITPPKKKSFSTASLLTINNIGNVIVFDGDNRYVSNLTQNTKAGIQLTGTLALVWPTTSTDGFKCKVIDDDYVIAFKE